MDGDGGGVGQTIIIVGFWSGILVYPILQLIAIMGTKGGMKILAFLPLIFMALVIVFTVVGLVQSSNLWPLMFIFYSPVAVIYLLVFVIVKQVKALRRNG